MNEYDVKTEDLLIIEDEEGNLDTDLVQSCDDAKTINEEVQAVADSIAALESVYEIIADCKKEGKMPLSTAKMAGVALEQIYQNLAIEIVPMNVSLESFETDTQGATKVALESIGERLKAAWQALVRMVVALVQKIIEFLVDNVKRFTYLGGYADWIAKKVGQLPDSKNYKKVQVSAPEVLERLSTTTGSTDGLALEYAGMVTYAQNIGKIFRSAAEQSGAVEILQSSNGDKISKDEAPKRIVAMLDMLATPGLWPGPGEYRNTKPTNELKVVSTRLFLGNVGWYAEIPQLKIKGPEIIGKVKFDDYTIYDQLDLLKFGTYEGHGKKMGESFTAFDDTQIRNIVATYKEYEALNKRDHAMISDMRAIEANWKRFADHLSLGNRNNVDDNALYSNVRHYLRALMKVLGGTGLSVPAKVTAVSKDMLKLCELSVKARLKLADEKPDLLRLAAA